MKIINKTIQCKNGCRKTSLTFCRIPIWVERKSLLERTLKLCGLPILSYKNKSDAYKNEKRFRDIGQFENYFCEKCKKDNKKPLLWIDHSLGGGTEIYSSNQFAELKSKCNILRLQYHAGYDCFIFSIPNEAVSSVAGFEDVKAIVADLDFAEICVNNIVGWYNALELLAFVAVYKKRHAKVKISFRGHDLQCLCPSFNLLNCEHVYCNLSYKDGCAACVQKIKLSDNEKINKILFSGFRDINEWRGAWGQFFADTLDEAVVFSNSTKDLLIRMYPVLNKKIKIIPHQVQALAKVMVKKHIGINIATLGNVNSVAKGRDVLDAMCKSNKDANIRFVVIGSYKETHDGLIVTGKYKPSELPLLIEKYDIDIVFIPSICPETFSYTTAEAMSMDIPVVCYNLGAPAERVAKYKKGLVLNEINPAENLTEIKDFVLKLRKEME